MSISDFSKKLRDEQKERVSKLTEKYEADYSLFGVKNQNQKLMTKKETFKKCSALKDGIFLFTPSSLAR